MTDAGLRRAAFLDRDGTLIRDAEFLSDPEGIEILPGVVEALKRLHDAGFLLIVVTNQSGIARGLMTEADYQAVRARLDADLAAAGVRLTATYHCPHYPDVSGNCECRKPGTLLYRQAAAAHRVDVARSIFVGDRWRDVAPALALGGRGFLVRSDATPDEDLARAQREATVMPSLADVVVRVVGELAG